MSILGIRRRNQTTPVTLFFLIYLFMYLFLTMLGLYCCPWAFSSCSKHRLLSSWGAWASRCSDFSCCGSQDQEHVGSVVVAHGLSCPGGMWNPPDQGLNCVPYIQFSSVQFSRSVVSDSLRSHEPQHARPPCLSPTPGVYPNSCPLSW